MNEAPHDTRRVKVISDKPAPRLLYKFISPSSQKPTWDERLRCLIGGSAFMSSPTSFNDPFDCLPTVDTPDTLDGIAARREEIVGRVLAQNPEATYEILSRQFDDLIAKDDAASWSTSLSDSMAAAVQTLGVFCVTQAIENVLMWSHYADSHKGFAVRFNLDRDPTSPFAYVYHVDYSDIRPSIHGILDGQMDADGYRRALCTKAKSWEYEQEWRVVDEDVANKYLTFNPKVIDAVILGCRMDTTIREQIIFVARKNGLEVLQATPCSRTFKMLLETI